MGKPSRIPLDKNELRRAAMGNNKTATQGGAAAADGALRKIGAIVDACI